MREMDRLMKSCDELIEKFYKDAEEWEAFRPMEKTEWRINQLQKLNDDISEIIKAHHAIENYYYDHPEEPRTGSGSLHDEIQVWVNRRENYREMKRMEEFPEDKKDREFTDEDEERYFKDWGDHE